MIPHRDPIASEPWVTAGARDHKKHNGDQVSVAAVCPVLFSYESRRNSLTRVFFEKKLRLSLVVESDGIELRFRRGLAGRIGGCTLSKLTLFQTIHKSGEVRRRMLTVKNWLKNSNGWQRLWLVLSLLGFLYAAGIEPFLAWSRTSQHRYELVWKVEQQLRNPDCKDYAEKPFSSLEEPDGSVGDGEGCWQLYSYREISKPKTLPLTAEALYEELDRTRWEYIGGNSIALGLFAVLISSLVYWAGVIVAWISRGFKKTTS